VCDLLVADSVRGSGTEAGNHPASGIPSPGDRCVEQRNQQQFNRRPSPVAFAHPATGVWKRAVSIAAMQPAVIRPTHAETAFCWPHSVCIAAMQPAAIRPARRYPAPGCTIPRCVSGGRLFDPTTGFGSAWHHRPVARCARQVGDCPSPRQHSSRRGVVPLCRASWQATGSGRPHFEPSAASSPTGLCTALSSKRPHFEPFAVNAMTGRCIAVPGKRRHFETEPQSEWLSVAATVFELPAWFVYLAPFGHKLPTK
jgi:hypothetical protein